MTDTPTVTTQQVQAAMLQFFTEHSDKLMKLSASTQQPVAAQKLCAGDVTEELARDHFSNSGVRVAIVQLDTGLALLWIADVQSYSLCTSNLSCRAVLSE